jgi:hypothetical protein
MEASQNKSDVTIQFLVGGLVIHFAGIFPFVWFRSKVIQEFHVCAMVKKKIFILWGANMIPKIFFAYLETPKRHFLEKICVD